MATWTTIPDSSLEPGKPIRSIDALALRDNPVAIAEGQSGAPRIVDAALDTTATNDGRNWLLNRNALATAGAVGTYVMAIFSGASTAAITFGATTAGSNLQPVGAFTSTLGNSNANSGTGSALSGTWRCMGHKYAYVDGAPGYATNAVGTLWLRIA